MKNFFHVFLRMFTKFLGERPSKLAVFLCMALFASTTAFAEEYITDVMVIGGDKDRVNFLKDSCRTQGWSVIDKDLNDNAGVGTDYVYLLYKKSSEGNASNGFITDFIIKTDDYPDSYIFNGRTYYRIPHKGSEHFEIHGGNLNSGTVSSSTNMRLYYTKEEFPDRRFVRDIAFTDAMLKSGYTTLGRNGAVVGSDGSGAMDLNEGAGSSSDYIYMHFATVSSSMDTPEYISDVVVLGGSKDEVNALKERYASRGWIVIDQDLNDNAGAGTDYIYMAYKKSHFSDVNKGFITDFIIKTGEYPDTYKFNGRTYYRVSNFGDGNFAIYGGNLNSGTVSSSTNMWLYFTRESFPDTRVVSDIAFTVDEKTLKGYTTLGENGAAVGSDGSGAMDLNEGAGSSSDYIYMHFATAPKVNITFVTGLNNVSVPMQTVVSGSTATKPADLERSGFTFMGWYTTADGNTQFDFSAPITSNTTVYARWGHIVTFVTGDANSVVPTQSVFVGDASTKPSDPERTGLRFAGWYADESFSTEFDFSAPITKNTTVYAKWEASVTFVIGDENVSVPAQTVVVGNTPTKPNDPERTGLRFVGWYADDAFTTEFDFSAPVTSNTTAYAKWVASVTFVTGDENVSVPAQTVVVGNTPTKPNDPERTGLRFVGWYADDAFTTVYDFSAPVTNDVSVYARWWKGIFTDLSTLTDHHVAENGELLMGTLGGNYKVSIADGATVTFDGVTINGVNDYAYKWAGLTCKGDCKIILKGENSVKGFYQNYPGIYVPERKTLTIEGDGSLDASSNGGGAGIGGGEGINCGNIVINAGTVTATGGASAAGIGSGYYASAGSITVSGGTVTATGGLYAAGIGSGYNATAGSITITDGVTLVTANKGERSPNSVGLGDHGKSVGKISIGGVFVDGVSTSPFTYPANDLYTYTIVFDANGGEGTMSNQKMFLGISSPLSANVFTRSNHIFVGWNTKADGSGTSYADGASVLNLTDQAGASVTLYAQWLEGNVVNLKDITNDFVVQDGYLLKGTLGGNYKVSIADGATVTLDGVTINGVNKLAYQWAGLTCKGDCKIILKGENSVRGFYENYPGIYVPERKTLTVEGDGSLDASSNGFGAGIGGGYYINCGNIVINDGTVIAMGGSNAAGIGSGYHASAGSITISGGTVTATGGKKAAGIGSGHEASAGSITISGGSVTATGGIYAAGIGSGHYATAGDITITDGVTLVTAKKGEEAPYSVGSGDEGSVGTITIGGVVTAPITAGSYTFQTYDVVFDANGGTGSMEKQHFVYDAEPIALAKNTFTREGDMFVGWNTKADGSGTTYADEEKVRNLTDEAGGKVTLYAQWGMPYIDGNGKEQIKQSGEYIVLTGTTDVSTLSSGWYVVMGEVTYENSFDFAGKDVHLILADGAKLTVVNNRADAKTEFNNLSIYAQSKGDKMGAFLVNSSNGDAIKVGENFVINGGAVTAAGSVDAKVFLAGGTAKAYGYKGSVSVKDGLFYTDGKGNSYTAGENGSINVVDFNGENVTSSFSLNMIAGKNMHPYIPAIQFRKFKKSDETMGTLAELNANYNEIVPFGISEEMTVDSVAFTREFTTVENGYATVLFPFDVQANNLEGVERVVEFGGVDNQYQVIMNSVWTKNGLTDFTLKAHTPYMVHMSNPTLTIHGPVTLKPIEKDTYEVEKGYWKFIGTYVFKVWSADDKDLNHAYGYTTVSSSKFNAGEFVIIAKNAITRAFRAYLVETQPQAIVARKPSQSNAGSQIVTSSSNSRPDHMDVIIVDKDEDGKEHTTVIGRFNTRTGEIKLNPAGDRVYDLKGRSIRKDAKKAKGVYYGKNAAR